MPDFNSQIEDILKSVNANDHESALTKIQTLLDNGFFVANLILYKGVIGKYFNKPDSVAELTGLMRQFRQTQTHLDENRLSKHPLIVEALFGLFRDGRHKDLMSVSELVGCFDDSIAAIIGTGQPPQDDSYQTTGLIEFSKSDFEKDKFSPRVIFATRRFWDGPESRRHDLGPRFQKAFTRHGWAMELIDFDYPGSESNERIIQAVEKEEKLDCDIFMVDAQSPYFDNRDIRAFGNSVRNANPNLITIGVFPDSWIPSVDQKIAEYDESFDFIWEVTGRRKFAENFKAEKILYLPVPIGIDVEKSNPGDKIRFSGGINLANFSRLFWLSHFTVNHTDIDVDISGHESEDTDVLDSYRKYMGRVSSARIGINLTTRTNGTQIVPGRAYETMAAGVPLVQEYAEDMHQFFEPGVHYLEFSNFEEFDELSRRYFNDETALKEIGVAGYQKFKNDFSDHAILSHVYDRIKSKLT